MQDARLTVLLCYLSCRIRSEATTILRLMLHATSLEPTMFVVHPSDVAVVREALTSEFRCTRCTLPVWNMTVSPPSPALQSQSESDAGTVGSSRSPGATPVVGAATPTTAADMAAMAAAAAVAAYATGSSVVASSVDLASATSELAARAPLIADALCTSSPTLKQHVVQLGLEYCRTCLNIHPR